MEDDDTTKKEEAIVTDVSDEEIVEVEEIAEEVVPVISPREAMISDIVSENLEAREGFDGDEPVGEVEVEGMAENIADETVTLNVDGKEIVVPKSEVEEAGVRTLQKETSADARLELVSSKEKDLLRREEELRALEEDILQKRDLQDLEPDKVGQEFADALYEDEELVAKTITSITQDIASLKKQTAATIKKAQDEEDAKSREVVKYYHTSYEDISKDPDMHNSLNRRLATVAEDNPDFTAQQIIDEAASQVYERFGEKPDPNPQKKAKENMPSRVKKAAGRKAAVPVKQKTTRGDVIDSMRGRRSVNSY